jgi:glycosyltransferase involved in cell wall biosynthesis
MRFPLVTVVTPSYNQGRFIRATIESVLGQDYPALEYIIMDGGSTDETAAIVKEYGSRVTWISENDRGQANAINKGFRQAKGVTVAWINSDDVVLPRAVSRAVAAFAHRPELGAVYGEGYTIDGDGDVTNRFTATEPFNLWKLVYVWDYVLQQTVYFRKSVLEEIGYLDERLHWGMDWDVLIRIGMRYPIGYIPEYMGALREHLETKTASGGRPRFRELVHLMRRHGGRRYPPGYFIYGVDTYERILRTSIQRWTPAPLTGLVTRVHGRLTTVPRRWIDRMVTQSQGWYSDGWAAPRVEYLLSVGSTGVHIRGSVPDIRAALTGQSLRVICNGRTVGDIAVPVGDFDLTFALPAEVGGSCANIVLKASRWLVPEKIGLSADSRRLAYLLLGIHEIGGASCGVAPTSALHR